MNLAHVHLLLNHFPTVGFGVGLGLFLVALFGKSEELKKTSLIIFVVMAMLAFAAYVSGNAAQMVIKGREGISDVLIKAHQDAALLAFIFMETTGVLAWIGLWQYRQIARTQTWTVAAVLILSIVSFGLMAQAANLGGEIRHPEIVAAADATPASPHELVQTATIVASFVIDNPWVWPGSETLHFIGLSLLFGIVLTVNLRMLGMIRSVPFSAMHRLLPWGMLGLAINTVTGMLFFVAKPEQYTYNLAFQLKVVFLLLAGGNLLFLTVFDDAWVFDEGDEPALPVKLIAACSIFLWVGVIFFGRMLPYIGSE
jgi:uncharacterized membrane protein